MSNPLISILIPVKNADLYLADCLDSILQQSCTDWEIIAVDDHSEDNSFEILNSYAQLYSQISVFKNLEQGIIPALRLAYSKSTGQFITRMDADDIMTPKKLESLKTCLEEHGKGHIAIGLVEYFAQTTLGDGYLKYQNWLNQLSLSHSNYLDIYKECVIPSPCWMIHRSDLDRCEAFQPDIYPEDYDLCFRFYKNNLQIKVVPEVLHRWRDHLDRTSRNDPKYANVHFFELKMKYFMDLDYDPNSEIILWGAGKKGKKLANALIEKQINFRWITNNPKKLNRDIYGIHLEDSTLLATIKNPTIIIAVAAPDAVLQIQGTLDHLGLIKSRDYFYFC